MPFCPPKNDVLDPVKILLELLHAELGTSMSFQLSTTGMMDPSEILLELLPAGLETSVSRLSNMGDSLDKVNDPCGDSDLYELIEVSVQIPCYSII